MSDTQLRILSWNIRQGAGNRTVKIAQFIIRSGASIVQLSEYRNNKNGVQLRTHLLRAGYRFQFITAAPGSENSVFIASTLAADLTLSPLPLEHRHKYIEVDFGAFRIMGLYMPHKKQHKLFHLIEDRINQSANPAMVMGDLNTGKNYVDQKGDSFWYTEEFNQLLSNRFADAFRHFYPKKSDYSWYSHQGNGYRYDHILVDQRLLPIIVDCYYLHEAREQGLSDHSAMLLELKA